ncbi:truncated adenine specific DNA methylase Mod [Aminobacter sp. Y103A]|nr:truncated adenine specific DNA methylase Mod [Aminobacter sp. SS-2016]
MQTRASGPQPCMTYQIYTPYSPEYVAEHFVHKDPDGRLFRRSDLVNPAVRPNLRYDYHASNGRVYKPHSNGWKVSLEVMRQLDRENRLFFPAKDDARLRKKIYLDESPGVAASDVWDDLPPIHASSQERLGYPTQKPESLLERIVSASSNKGDVVLDPFCGCGTAIHAAEQLGRKWIGIDVTYLAIHVIEERLVKAFGHRIKGSYTLYGRPEDAEDAKALAARDWLEFQKWAVFTLDGLPKDRPGADGGIDGIIRYHQLGKDRASRAIVSVKGGLNVGVDAIHKLKSVVKREEAEIGVLVCVNPPTGPMLREAASEGETGPSTRRVPRIQIVTIEQLFHPAPVLLPGMVDPPEVLSAPLSPAKRGRKRVEGQTEMLFPIEGTAEAQKRKSNRTIRSVDIEVTRSAYTRKSK